MQSADTLSYGHVCCYTHSPDSGRDIESSLCSLHKAIVWADLFLFTVGLQAKAQVHCISCVSSRWTKCQSWVVVGKIVTVFLCYHLMCAGM